MNLNEDIDRIKNLMGIKNSYQDNIINEAITDIVYHFTTTTALMNILKTNKFFASFNPFNKQELELSKGRYFYFSTTRNKMLRLFISLGAKIKLDGKKLSQKYKGIPIDFFYKRGRKSSKSPEYSGTGQQTEFEDRIILDKPYIENATKYILSISLLIKDKYDYNEKWLNDIAIMCEDKNIPLLLYENENDFLSERNPIDPKEKIKYHTTDEYSSEIKYNENDLWVIALVSYKNDIPIESLFHNLNESDKIDIKYYLSIFSSVENESTELEKIEFIHILKNRVRNLSDSLRETSKYILLIMLKDMRKYKTRDILYYIQEKLGQDESK